MDNHIEELTRLLPYPVRERLHRDLDHVHDRLVDIASDEQVADRADEIRDMVDLVFLLRLLYSYLVVGFGNYHRMLAYLENKHANGMRIGGTVLARDSMITRQWSIMASELEALVRWSGVGWCVRPGVSVDEVLRSMLRSLRSDVEGLE